MNGENSRGEDQNGARETPRHDNAAIDNGTLRGQLSTRFTRDSTLSDIIEALPEDHTARKEYVALKELSDEPPADVSLKEVVEALPEGYEAKAQYLALTEDLPAADLSLKDLVSALPETHRAVIDFKALSAPAGQPAEVQIDATAKGLLERSILALRLHENKNAPLMTDIDQFLTSRR